MASQRAAVAGSTVRRTVLAGGVTCDDFAMRLIFEAPFWYTKRITHPAACPDQIP